MVCIVRDCSSRVAQPKFTLPVHPWTVVDTIFEDVASHYSYDVNSFDLVLQSARGDVVSIIILL